MQSTLSTLFGVRTNLSHEITRTILKQVPAENASLGYYLYKIGNLIKAKNFDIFNEVLPLQTIQLGNHYSKALLQPRNYLIEFLQ